MRAALLFVLLVAASAVAASDSFRVNRDTFEHFMCSDEATCVSIDHDPVPTIFQKIVRRASSFLSDALNLEALIPSSTEVKMFSEFYRKQLRGAKPSIKSMHAALRDFKPAKANSASNATYPFFAWMPIPVVDAIPGKAWNFSTPCFNGFVSTAYLNSSFVAVTIDLLQQKSWFCSDAIFMVGGGAVSLQDFNAVKTIVVNFDVSGTVGSVSKQWYLNTSGIRIFRFQDGFIDTILQLLDTLNMMSGFGTMPLPSTVFENNINFINNYIQAVPRMQPQSKMRSGGASVARNIDPSYINSGDAFLILRPDGLDPMIGWGEGSNVGHSTIAIRHPNGDLHVCESTTIDGYWKTKNGVQCHGWEEWIKICDDAEMNIVHLPLSPKYSKMFNVTRAIEFFEAHKGIDYGYSTFIFGWLDTQTANFPCVPPNYTTCLFPQSAELIAVLLDDIFENSHQNFFRQALNHRVGTWPAPNPVIHSIYIAATQLNISFRELYTIPEQDAWMYNTTRNNVTTINRSMVCCVFVCAMWKAAGLFSEIGNQIQCGEQTLWDIYSMAIFDENKFNTGRPKVCQDADPTNMLCQIMGNITLHLVPDVNTRSLYPNMGQKCTSQGPQYIRSPGC
jgi:hypothetical protein